MSRSFLLRASHAFYRLSLDFKYVSLQRGTGVHKKHNPSKSRRRGTAKSSFSQKRIALFFMVFLFYRRVDSSLTSFDCLQTLNATIEKKKPGLGLLSLWDTTFKLICTLATKIVAPVSFDVSLVITFKLFYLFSEVLVLFFFTVRCKNPW